jgi:hypothetical protein
MFEESGHLCDEPDPTRDPKALPLRHVSMREMRLPMSPILSVSRWHKDVADVRKSLMPPPHRHSPTGSQQSTGWPRRPMRVAGSIIAAPQPRTAAGHASTSSVRATTKSLLKIVSCDPYHRHALE